ncbi:hypothetical protein VOLCADRAFT_106066 [Volvox carteri f. nagariensis]|uniref:Uncharacterized protein n=1 Tax=Volvox carteri f. nagariensis TaxID=3068 RepID=D8U4V2_VOLCA|nr:uncharacterized protein VOLCADRAFT_106066 [Volvox carteri f. nagariensis]EFJ45338.1 hypothetical protein VOLCADRAFT_106066 [Volvox carteri f. nagariensis]|eukprot:XP_002953714.1 hypothetical protein VOLCADRAFT_106066 [Volvox carteri f. nagariensis]
MASLPKSEFWACGYQFRFFYFIFSTCSILTRSGSGPGSVSTGSRWLAPTLAAAVLLGPLHSYHLLDVQTRRQVGHQRLRTHNNEADRMRMKSGNQKRRTTQMVFSVSVHHSEDREFLLLLLWRLDALWSLLLPSQDANSCCPELPMYFEILLLKSYASSMRPSPQ